MRLTISKSKNAEQLYITKAYRDSSGKSTSKIMKKLGSMASLLPDFDHDRDKVLAWGKEQARLMTEEEEAGTLQVHVQLSEERRKDVGEKPLKNIGYLFAEQIFHGLGLPDFCKQIKQSSRLDYDLSDILAKLVYARILAPASKHSSFQYAQKLMDQPHFDLHQIYRALSELSKNSDALQAHVYRQSSQLIPRNNRVLYYDCTNYFFELEEEKGMRKYGKSKEHRPNPIVQMGLFLDGDGLPLAFTMFPGNASEQPTLKPLERIILQDFGLSQVVVCTDAGLASHDNRIFNAIQGRAFVVTQSLKTMKKPLREWALDPTGWHTDGAHQSVDLREINEEQAMETLFYKERWIHEKGLEQRLIITFSLKHKCYQQALRQEHLERAQKIIHRGATPTRNTSSPSRFIEEIHLTQDGELADQTKQTLDLDRLEKEAMFDGFYGVCTNLEDDARVIMEINKQRWQVESAFRTMKSEFKARPVFLQRDERIEAHFLTCYLALLITKIIQMRLPREYSMEEIIHTMRQMHVCQVGHVGYLSAYERTSLTDDLHDIAGFHTDREYISEKTMKNILKQAKSI